jgi:dTDP-4-dehydrorhamnose reductase
MITVIGHGYVGEYIVRELLRQDIVFQWVRHGDFRLDRGCTAIINAAGFTGKPNVDACESRIVETIDGNVIWPLRLESFAGSVPVIHISSGCVYTGYKEGGWLETDPPNFTMTNGSVYSGSKAIAQDVLTPYMNKSYILRIRMPFGKEEHSSNLITKLSRYEKLVNFRNSISYINDVASVAVSFANYLPTPGIYNVCNSGSVTTKEIAKICKLNKQWFTEEEFNNAIVAPRSNCTLNTDKLTKLYPLISAQEALTIVS